MNDNPTTGEWTVGEHCGAKTFHVYDKSGVFVGEAMNSDQAGKFVDSHNAALAAERGRAEFAEVDACELRQQLAAAVEALDTGLKRIKAGNIQAGVMSMEFAFAKIGGKP